MQLLLRSIRPTLVRPRAIAHRLARASLSLSPARRPDLKRSLKLSVWEGISAEIVSSCAGSAVLTAWALHFKASPLLLGLIISLSQLGQFLQLPAAWITSTFGARKTALVAVAASRQVLLPLAILPFVRCGAETQRALLITIAVLSALLGVIGNNAWVVWMGDLVPKRIRGRYFGRRTAICTTASAIGGLSSGLLLDFARSHGVEHRALALLAIFASLAGAASTWLMLEQGPTRQQHQRVPFDLSLVKAPWRDPAARPLLAYQLGWNAAVGLAGSFFTAFMVQHLHMGFAVIAFHAALTAGARVLAAPTWGRIIDELGAKPVLVFCSSAIALLPLLWLGTTPATTWLIWCDPLLAGILWGGHAQAIFQLPLTITPRRERSYYLATFSMVGGFSFTVATSVAGLLAARMPHGVMLGTSHLANYQVLFLLSAVGRGAAALLAPKIVENGGQSVQVLWSRLAPRRVWRRAQLILGLNRAI